MKKLLFFLIVLICLTTSCASSPVRHTSFVMDSLLEFDVAHKSARELIDECSDLASELESVFSVSIETSDVSRFNACDSVLTADERTARLVGIANTVCELSDGAYDISIRPLVSLWDITHHAEDWIPPDAEAIANARARLAKITTDNTGKLQKSVPSAEIDLGGIGKGYTLGALASLLDSKGASGLISFGGSVALFGDSGKTYNVGIKNPLEPTSLFGALALDSGMIAVSGGYERYAEYDGKRYHHIIDPATGYPSDSDLASALVWVNSLSPEAGAYADALSTAFFVLGGEQSLELYDELRESSMLDFEFGLLLIDKNGSVTLTAELENRFTEYK